MPRNNLASIFLVSVLVIGLASYPISLQSGVVFADDDDKGPNNDKGPKNDKEKGPKNDKEKGPKNDKGSSDIARSFEDDDEDEVEIKVKVEDGVATVEFEIGNEEFEFEFILISTNPDDVREEIENEILARTDLTIDQLVFLEIEFEDEEFDNDNDNGNGKVTICHAPPGNPENAHTISVGPKAATSHLLRHVMDTMGACQEITEPDVPVVPSQYSINGITYSDENKNGTIDDNELGLDGWEVVLILSSDSSTVDETITEVNGKYKFENLEEGTYNVKTIQPNGWIQTEPDAESHIVELSENENIKEGINFGNYFATAESNELFQTMTKTKASSIQDAEETISKLMKKIEQLEKRIQKLLLKVESGEYFGNISDGDPVVKSLGISFEGTATSLDDGSDVENSSGEIFIETLVTRDNASKFRVIGGEIELGGTEYDLIFGKARISSTGTSGEKDSMVLIAHIVDDTGNDTTVKLLLDFEIPLEGDFGLEPIDFQIKSPQSKISDDWTLSGSGQLTVV